MAAAPARSSCLFTNVSRCAQGGERRLDPLRPIFDLVSLHLRPTQPDELRADSNQPEVSAAVVSVVSELQVVRGEGGVKQVADTHRQGLRAGRRCGRIPGRAVRNRHF